MANASLSIPIRLKTREDRRCADRFEVALPLRVDGQPGTTRDLSSSGISFRAKRPYVPGALLDIVIEYLVEGVYYPMQYQAQVVRCVADASGFIIGAQLLPPVPHTAVSPADERLPSRPALHTH